MREAISAHQRLMDQPAAPQSTPISARQRLMDHLQPAEPTLECLAW